MGIDSNVTRLSCKWNVYACLVGIKNDENQLVLFWCAVGLDQIMENGLDQIMENIVKVNLELFIYNATQTQCLTFSWQAKLSHSIYR